MTLKSWVALTLLAAAAAGQASAGVAIKQLAAPAPAAVTTPAAADTSALTTIYSTLSKDATQVYDYGWGPSILGPLWHLQGVPGTRGPQQHFAVPFKAKANLSLTQLIVPLTHDGSKDLSSLRVAVHADASGLPGEALYTWEGVVTQHTLNADNTARQCCSYTTPAVAAGTLRLTKGQHYWVVVSTTEKSRFEGLWFYNSRGLTGTSAYLNDSGAWQPVTDALLPAVGVFGVPAE